MPPGDPGVDLARLTGWLAPRTGLVPPLTATRVHGGLSNLTYVLGDAAGRRWVLRRPPLHGVLPSAHDVLREHRVMTALAGSAVPVPATVGAEASPGVLGAPFFVMEHVAGVVLRTPADSEATLTAGQRRHAAHRLVETLARLHDIVPERVGLGDLGRHDGYVHRQLRRWSHQWEASRTRDQPIAAEVHRRLGLAVPPQRRTSIVHGDFRLDNMVVDERGDIRAVLDWELCTLGDPLADLGTTLAYWLEPDEPPLEHLPLPTGRPGFPTREELRRRYAALTGDDPDDVGYYTALGRWKIAIILEGVYARYVSGAMGGSGSDPSGLVRSADRLFRQALVDLDRTGAARPAPRPG
jgi:aminoglycoside phosphotransferase (APT) family kinase protein